jgi:hypothetical protein
MRKLIKDVTIDDGSGVVRTLKKGSVSVSIFFNVNPDRRELGLSARVLDQNGNYISDLPNISVHKDAYYLNGEQVESKGIYDIVSSNLLPDVSGKALELIGEITTWNGKLKDFI